MTKLIYNRGEIERNGKKTNLEGKEKVRKNGK